MFLFTIDLGMNWSLRVIQGRSEPSSLMFIWNFEFAIIINMRLGSQDSSAVINMMQS